LAGGRQIITRPVWKIAEWTRKSVNYDLSTLNSKTTYKASWVLAKKDGVLRRDNYIVHFALLRAVGIPARLSLALHIQTLQNSRRSGARMAGQRCISLESDGFLLT